MQQQIATEQDSESESDEQNERNPVLHDQYVLWKKTDPPIVAGDSARLEVYNMEMNDYKMRVKAIREEVQGSERYKSVIDGIALSKNNESSPQTKKHLIKSLKPFTGQSQNKDKSSHGWIDEA